MLRRCEKWHRTRYQYDICISFAGEDRLIAKKIANQLRQKGNKVFYDGYEEADNCAGLDSRIIRCGGVAVNCTSATVKRIASPTRRPVLASNPSSAL
jgi:hypothetical protein